VTPFQKSFHHIIAIDGFSLGFYAAYGIFFVSPCLFAVSIFVQALFLTLLTCFFSSSFTIALFGSLFESCFIVVLLCGTRTCFFGFPSVSGISFAFFSSSTSAYSLPPQQWMQMAL